MLEVLLIVALLIGVPIFVVSVLAGAAAYVRERAERDLEAMERAGELTPPDDPISNADDAEDSPDDEDRDRR